MGPKIKPREWGQKRAESAARLACRGYDLPSPRLVRISHSAVFFVGDDLVMRVEQQGRPVWAGMPLSALTGHVGSVGVTTSRPAVTYPQVVIDGLYVTLYRRVVEFQGMSDVRRAALLGRQLRTLHDNASVEKVSLLNRWDVDLDYAPVSVKRIIQQLRAMEDERSTSLAAKDVKYLLSEMSELGSHVIKGLERSRSRVQGRVQGRVQMEQVVLHGDAHLGNTIPVGPSELAVIDLEHAGFGERAFDHIHILLSDTVFDREPLYEHFSQGYGEDLSGFPDMDAWVRIIAISYLTWTASVGEHSRPHRDEARLRMEWWRRSPDAPTYWNAGF